MQIVRHHGCTGRPCNATADMRRVVATWGWLLPVNGMFATKDLADAIKKSRDVGNPKVAYDLGVLEKETD